MEQAEDSSKSGNAITRSLRQIEEGIQRGLRRRAALGEWSKNVGWAAVGLGALALVAKAPLFLGLTVLAVAGYGALNIASYLTDRDLNDKYKAQASLTVAQGQGMKNAPENAPAPSASNDNLGAKFADAGRVSELESEVRDLKSQVEAKPVVLDKPKAKGGMFSRLVR